MDDVVTESARRRGQVSIAAEVTNLADGKKGSNENYATEMRVNGSQTIVGTDEKAKDDRKTRAKSM